MTSMRRGHVLGAIPLALAVMAAPAQGARAQTFRVDAIFKQSRTWNHFHQQVGDPCTITTEGAGLDSVNLHGSGLLTVRSGRGVAGLAIRGNHHRAGKSVWTSSGVGCPGSEVAANTGCGDKKVRPVFPTLTLTGRKLKLRWAGAALPDFSPCPFFDGANEGEGLPGAGYLDMAGTIVAKELSKARKKRGVAGLTAKAGGEESCQTLSQPCPDGVTYNASARVTSTVFVILKPYRRR